MNKHTIVYLLRHGEAEGNISRHFHGHYDSDLTSNGLLQAELAAKRLASEPIEVIYSSDLMRAYKTAQEVAKIKNLEIQVEKNLREIHGGDWENIRWDDLPQKFPESYMNWEDAPHLLEIPGGETMREFQKRLISCMETILEQNRGKSVLVTTHGTAIRTMMCYFKGLPLEQLNQIHWYDNTALSILQFDCNNTCEILLEGDNSHLGDLSTLARQDWWKKENGGFKKIKNER